MVRGASIMNYAEKVIIFIIMHIFELKKGNKDAFEERIKTYLFDRILDIPLVVLLET